MMDFAEKNGIFRLLTFSLKFVLALSGDIRSSEVIKRKYVGLSLCLRASPIDHSPPLLLL